MQKTFVLALLLTACTFGQDDGFTQIHVRAATGEHVPFRVEIADENAERQQGLMHRTSLEEGTGMLFVFESESPRSFWMKNTLIPLDIIFFAADGEYVSHTTMVPCEKDPCVQYPSKGPAKYALEVPAETAFKIGVGENWRLMLE